MIIFLKVIICHNTNSKYSSDVANTIIESMLQGYDYCRANYDTLKLEHLACTKVI